jgi:alanyl-tRNA synthetase
MKTTELREIFLNYFKERQHQIVPSSSLVPNNDPTLLFTNAGMVQFKETFLGLEPRAYTRAASSQRCLRAGGKHNDLENVGYTARHHTFFEMLGNFSFGDYFKREAIQYAWDFLTRVLKLPPERLWVTVYEKDLEAEEIWLNEIKVDKTRFSRCGEADNFWSMGDTGPCGPCSEIYYDHGPEIAGGPPGTAESEGDRYIEIWNLVFMQYNRSEDGTLTALPKPSVDTGMGFERIAAVMQGVHSNYEIDIFQYLIKAIAKLGNIKDLENKSLRVVADHIRACAFLIVDGVFPSNEGRGYVLRRIARRAIRHGHRLGFTEPFFYKLVKPLAEVMGEAYPELLKSLAQVEKVLLQEEQQFAKTLDQGLKILEQDIAKLSKPSELSELSELSDNVISGETVFRLYDTYGFPIDLTADIARERGLSLDVDGFEAAMAKQRSRAREASQFSGGFTDRIDISHKTDFSGYETLEEVDTVLELYSGTEKRNELKQGEEGAVVLDRTPFYAEAGGQVGDQGVLRFKLKQENDGAITNTGATANTGDTANPGSTSELGEFIVKNTRKMGQAHLHYGVVSKGTIKVNQKVEAVVDKEKRRATALNHSATHLLHAALRLLLGPHVQQKGSLVEPLRLRFDFTHPEALTLDQIRAVEKAVNEQVLFNTEVQTDIMSVEDALQSGAMALFGEKYGDKVRVLRMGGDYSVELCGGTHVGRTGDIGIFKITSESGISAGVRRLEAVTGLKALELINQQQSSLDMFAALLKTGSDPKSIKEKLEQMINKNNKLEKELQALNLKLVSGSGAGAGDISAKAKDIKGVKVLVEEVSIADPKMLREMMDRLKDKLKSAVIVLAAVNDGKISLVAGVTSNCSSVMHAGNLIKELSAIVGGQGGGRADMAQGGGNDISRLPEALKAVEPWVLSCLQDKVQLPPN